MDHTVLPANNTMPAFPSSAFTRWRHHSKWGSRHPIAALLLIYRPRRDERLSWPVWLTYNGWLTHISGHPSATGQAQDSESSPAKDRRSTAGPRNQPRTGGRKWQSSDKDSKEQKCRTTEWRQYCLFWFMSFRVCVLFFCVRTNVCVVICKILTL